MANARNERRRRNRVAKQIGRDFVHESDRCACFGAINGEARFAVRPAICSHWFYTKWEERDGEIVPYLDHTRIRIAPISDLKMGADLTVAPIRVSVGLSFKKGSAYALKFSHDDMGRPLFPDGNVRTKSNNACGGITCPKGKCNHDKSK
jgi:hypothetical protein